MMPVRHFKILTDSYNRSGGDTHPSGSHKFFFSALPGFLQYAGQIFRQPIDSTITPMIVPYCRKPDSISSAVLTRMPTVMENLDDGEDLNNNGMLDRALVNDVEYTSQSNLYQTWPAFWPPHSYVGDLRDTCTFEQGDTCNPGPGVRAGKWNGAYGAFVRGDQESYYLADDRDNDEFNYAPFLDPATGEPDRRILGQWWTKRTRR